MVAKILPTAISLRAPWSRERAKDMASDYVAPFAERAAGVIRRPNLTPAGVGLSYWFVSRICG